MNYIEKFVYDLVKKNPKLKNKIRDIYQKVLSFIPKKEKQSKYDIIERRGFFYGFHDKIPWSLDNNKLLAHKVLIDNRKIEKNDKTEIGYFCGDDFLDFKKLAETKSWNWQQGSMLQWLGRNDKIIYNDWDGNKNIAKIIDKNGDLITKLDYPIGAVSENGEYALSYSFARLNRGMPGYGYPFENDKLKEEKIPENSGLKLLRLENRDVKDLFSIKDIFEIQTEESMNNAYHFFTHCLFSYNKDKFLFLHRWLNEGKRLKSRLISYDIKNDKLFIFPTNGMVSHFTWVNNDKVFAYANTETHGDGYYLFEDNKTDFQFINNNNYSNDGHPQYCLANGFIVTDTYPNRFRIQELSVFDLEDQQKEIIAKLKSPLDYKEQIRCDLHPRWDRSGKQICFDSAHLGKRSLCTLKYKNDL